MNEKKEFAGKYALDKYQTYGNCAQAVIWGVSQIIPEIDEQLIIAAHSLGGGGTIYGEGACGSLAGGMLALGAIFGRPIKDMGEDDHDLNIKLNKELYDKFHAYFKGHTCQDFQKKYHDRVFNLSDPLEKKLCKTEDYKNNCERMVLKVSEWVTELILDNQ